MFDWGLEGVGEDSVVVGWGPWLGEGVADREEYFAQAFVGLLVERVLVALADWGSLLAAGLDSVALI
jgi:hypothetical protein